MSDGEESLKSFANTLFNVSDAVLSEIIDDSLNGLGSKQERFNVESNEGKINENIFMKKNQVEGHLTVGLKVVNKELLFYSELMPLVKEVCSTKNYPLSEQQLQKMIAKFHGHFVSNSHHHQIFEDFSNDFSVFFSHSEVQALTVIKNLAIFHGCMHAFKAGRSDHLTTMFPLTGKDYLLAPENKPFLEPFYNGGFRDALAVAEITCMSICMEENVSSLVKEKVSIVPDQATEVISAVKFLRDNVPDALELLCKVNALANEDMSCLIHGDFHPLNVAVSHDGMVKLFDFQLVRYSDGLNDLHQYISQGCSPKMMRENTASIQEAYHTSLTETCRLLGMAGSPYGDDYDFLKRFKSFSPRQVILGLSFQLWKSSDHITEQVWQKFEELRKKLSGIRDVNFKTDAWVAAAEEIFVIVDSLGPKIWEGVQLIIDLIIEFKRNGTLDAILELPV